MHNTLCRRGAARAAALSAAGICLRFALTALILLSAASVLMAQQDSTVQWKTALQDLEQRLAENPASSPSTLETWSADADALRSSLAAFAASHPDLQVSIPAPLAATSDASALKAQLDALRSAVDQLVKQTPGNPFNLGVISVNVTASGVSPEPVADGIDQTQIRDLDITNVANALDQLTGVSIQHLANNRNEAGILVRGFTTRGQVPFYLDGIPISVPYDGYVDFNRFLTSDIAEVQVTRGYSSPLMGPNALGGAINLVTREPAKPFEGEALIGTSSGDGLLSALHLGSRWRHFFFQGGLDWAQADYVPLSGNFQVNQYLTPTGTPDIVMTDRLNHSGYRDEKFSGRVGWTPKGQDEYVLSYANQKGEKGVPLYQGPNTAATFRSFWQWPYWDFASYNLHTNTGIGEASSIKFRAFYNQYRNDINMYSNDTYSVMNTTSAEQSMYNEHTDGGSTEFTTHLVKRNTLSGSFFLKDDTHKEFGIYPARAPFPQVLPNLVDEDQQASIGLQDVIAITERLRVTAGFNADHFNGIQGQSYNTALTGLVPFTCIASPANTSFSGCTAHVWTYNPQVAASYSFSNGGTAFVTFADRSRFPMLKDIYSTGLLSGLANPNLQPEHSRNWNAGYSQAFGAKTLAQIVLFRSDLRNAIESVYVADPGIAAGMAAFCPNSKVTNFCSEMANIGGEVHQGIEFQVRTTPISRLTLTGSYSFLNRDIHYDFSEVPTVSPINTSITILPTVPRNKLIGTATARFPWRVLGIVQVRYEGGLTLQDTTYASNLPQFLPFGESFATMDIGGVVPIRNRFSIQAGVKNLFDRNYYYTAGYPEAGRTWYLNGRFEF